MKKDTQRKIKSKNRHSHPFISCGKREKQILKYLNDKENEYFYIKKYSKENNINRSTIYNSLNSLQNKGLINKVRQVTTKGKKLLGVYQNQKKPFRGECRKEKLSTHYLKYKLKVKDRSKYRFYRLKELNPTSTKENKLKNFTEHYAYFDGCTVVIKSKTIMIHINDIITNSVEDAHLKAFNMALEKATQLSKIGIVTEEMNCPQGHYARVESYLSKKLHKIDKKYFLDLPNGSKFWIDFSDKREDETDDPEYRERLDEFFSSLMGTKSTLKDVDKIKSDLDKLIEVTKNQVKTAANLIQLHQIKELANVPQEIEVKNRKLPGYFG